MSGGTPGRNARRALVVCRRAATYPNPKAAAMVHLGAGITLAGYFASDVLELRACFFVGTLCGSFGAAYFAGTSAPHMLLIPLCWASVWCCLNGWRMAWLLYERQPVALDAEEEALYEAVFEPVGMTRRCFTRLCDCGGWVEYPGGTVLTREGETMPSMLLLQSGKVRLDMDGARVTMVRPGEFVGLPALEVLMHGGVKGGEGATAIVASVGGGEGEDAVAATAAERTAAAGTAGGATTTSACPSTVTRVRATVPDSSAVRAIAWELGALRQFLCDGRNPDATAAFLLLFNARLMEKLGRRDQEAANRQYMGMLRAVVCEGGVAVGAMDEAVAAGNGGDGVPAGGLLAELWPWGGRQPEQRVEVVISPQQKRALRAYRTKHQVDHGDHVKMLKRVGWTEEDFNDGAQRGEAGGRAKDEAAGDGGGGMVASVLRWIW